MHRAAKCPQCQEQLIIPTGVDEFSCVKCGKVLRIKPKTQQASVPIQPPVAPPQPASRTQKPSKSKRGIFPWILLGIWGLWAAAIVFNFAINIIDYDRIDWDNDIIIVDGQGMAISTWIGIGVFASGILAFILGFPATIASVVCYFFFPSPKSS